MSPQLVGEPGIGTVKYIEALHTTERCPLAVTAATPGAFMYE